MRTQGRGNDDQETERNTNMTSETRNKAGAGNKQRERSVMFAIPVEDRPDPTLGVRVAEALYRVAEIILAALALIATSPIQLFLAILVRRGSPGPALFFQDRAACSVPTLGRDLVNRDDIKPPTGGFEPDKLYWAPTTFRFVKFRSMYVDGEERFPEYAWWEYDIDPSEFTNMYHNLPEDPRITATGKWMRRLTLDELPNLWNVVTGKLRLIGPRPELFGALALHTEDQMIKYTVTPGLSCTWALGGRGDLTVGEKLAHDLEYVRTRSIMGDIRIILLTIRVLVTRRGAF